MTEYRDGRGQAQGIMTRAVLELVGEAGPEGIQRDELVDELAQRFPDTTPRHLRRHLTRMTSGRYRGRLERDPEGVFRLVG